MSLLFAEAQNFRSYKNIRFDFSSDTGIVVIIGENDSGKSNLLRLINLVATNQPKGDDYISWSGGDMTAKLGLSEGPVIERFRDVVWKKNKKNPEKSRFAAGTVNQYKINGEEPFNAVGISVPEQVKKILNINPTNINFQLDGPFLFNDSPADVAKHYNKVVNIEIIDRSLSAIRKTLAAEKSQLDKIKEDQKEQRQKLKSFAWLANAEKQLLSLEKLQATKLRLEQEYFDLQSLIEKLTEINTKKQKLSEIIKHEKIVNELIELDKLISKKTDEYNELFDLLDQWKAYQTKTKELKEVLKHEDTVKKLIKLSDKIENAKSEYDELSRLLKELDNLKEKEKKCKKVLQYENKIKELIKLDKELDRKTDEYNELFDLLDQWKSLNKQLESQKQEIIQLEDEYKKSLPNICPFLEIECEHLKRQKNG